MIDCLQFATVESFLLLMGGELLTCLLLGVVTGPILNMGSETRNDADSRVVGMVFRLGLSEGGLFTCDFRQ